jgi:hypothetical protein
VQERRATAEKVRKRHSFDVRARTIRSDVGRLRSGRAVASTPRASGPRLAILLPPAGRTPGDLAYSRLIAPLTREEAAPLAVELSPVDGPAPKGADLVAIQTADFPSVSEAEAAIGLARSLAARVIVDDAGSQGDGASLLLGNADERWFASDGLLATRGTGAGVVMRDALDQRLWRDFHRRPVDWAMRPLRVLVLGTAGLPTLVDVVRSSRLETAVALIAVGERRDDIAAPFVTIVERPAKDRPYSRFAHWLRAMPHMPVAMTLDADEADRSFLIHSALGAVSILTTAAGADFEQNSLALVADEAALPDLLRLVVADPRRFSGFAVGAAEYVWRERSAGPLAARMRARIRTLVG